MSYLASQRSASSPTPEGSRVSFAVVLGATLIVIGLGLVGLAVGMRDESPLFIVGGLLFGCGILRLTTALSRDERERRAYRANPNDPRWRDESTSKQLAGRTCVECRRKVVVGADAVSCATCAAAIHLDCRASHRDSGHGDREAAANE